MPSIRPSLHGAPRVLLRQARGILLEALARHQRAQVVQTVDDVDAQPCAQLPARDGLGRAAVQQHGVPAGGEGGQHVAVDVVADVQAVKLCVDAVEQAGACAGQAGDGVQGVEGALGLYAGAGEGARVRLGVAELGREGGEGEGGRAERGRVQAGRGRVARREERRVDGHAERGEDRGDARVAVGQDAEHRAGRRPGCRAPRRGPNE